MFTSDPDKIEILEEDVQENGGRKRRRAATKAVAKYVDSEDEEDKNEKEEGDDFKAEGKSTFTKKSFILLTQGANL